MSSIRSSRPNLRRALGLALLVLTAGVAPTFASLRPASDAPPAISAIVIGTNSCVGTNACLNAVGPIGDNSCNGQGACGNTTGAIGHDSCNGVAVCLGAGPIGNNSCSGFDPCLSAYGVGDNSCHGFDACQASTIGHDSCNSSGLNICYHAFVGDFSCNNDTNYACTNGVLGNCQNNTLDPAACDTQPDGRIRLLGGVLKGDDIYNDDASDQTASATAAPGKWRRFIVSIQNDATVADSFDIHLAAIGVGDSTARYLHGWETPVDLAPALDSDTLQTPTIEPGGVYKFRILVRLDATPGAFLRNEFQVVSVGNPANVDRVAFVLTSTTNPCLSVC